MLSSSIITRQCDGKRFKVVNLSHWSDIESLDGTETDYVKWYGGGKDGDYYVSHNKGFSYLWAKDEW